jgi:hypothetical protein
MNSTNIGKVYGSFSIISDVYIENKIKKVNVQCSCGKIRSCYISNLNKLNRCSKCYGLNKSILKHGSVNTNNISIVKIINDRKIIIKCHCGIIKTIWRTSFKKYKHCGCQTKKGIEHHAYKGYYNIPASLYDRVKNRAGTANIPFEITIEDMYELFKQQNGKCALTGIQLVITTSTVKGNASLDRIDNSLGYIKGNVWWLDKDINMMKNKYSLNKFINLCHLVSRYNHDIDIEKAFCKL